MTGKIKALPALLLLAALLLLLPACRGNPLPEGVEEEVLLQHGREVVALLNQGAWQEVYGLMRTDGQATTSPEAIQTYVEAVLEEAGPYEQEEEALATGQTLDETKERYATAVFYCAHEEEDVVYRIAFSQDMELMGFEMREQ